MMRLGKYQVRSRLARGGMAEIFLATAHGPEGFAKTVVLKRLLPHLAQRPEIVSMFLEEARLAAGLQHPNIVQIFGLEQEGEDPYICMEYLAGKDLGALLARAREAGRPIPAELAAQIVGSVAQGLQFAHQQPVAGGARRGIVHGDISLSNVVVTFVGEVKIVDFGIARAAGAVAQAFPGAVQGKLAYLPPEVLAGQQADHLTDVYALGVVAHELLTGERLFRREDDAAAARASRERPVPDPRERRPELPARLAGLALRCLERDPRRRPQSAGEIAAEIEAFFAESGIVPGPGRLAPFLVELFGADQARVALAPPAEPTATGTAAPPRPDLVPTGLGVKGVPLVTEAVARGKGNAFVRVVGEVPAALAKAGQELVAVPVHALRSAMRWSRPRLLASAAFFTLFGFSAGVALHQLRDEVFDPPAEGSVLTKEAAGALPVVEPDPEDPDASMDEPDAGVVELAEGRARPRPPRYGKAKSSSRGHLALTGSGEVYLRGSRLGRAPLVRALPPGAYEVALLDDAGQIKGAWIAVVRPGQTTRLRAPR